MTLTVTDPSGTTASVVQELTPVSPAPPTAAFTYSPGRPLAAQVVHFTAAASAAAPGQALTDHGWNFGDGTTGAGITTSHAFAHAGTYFVTLTVTDDAGQRRTQAQPIAVGAAVVAGFSVSPANPVAGQRVFVNGSDTTTAPGATIVEYAWDFGNGESAVDPTPSASTDYKAAGTYTIRLTVQDSAGRTATATREVSVAPVP